MSSVPAKPVTVGTRPSADPAPPTNRTTRALTQEQIDNPNWLDLLGDLMSGIVPGLVFSIAIIMSHCVPKNTNDKPDSDSTILLRESLGSVVPIVLISCWYIYKIKRFGRVHKIGDLRWKLMGNGISVLMMIIVVIIAAAQ
jgi:hypothetical protein